MPHTLREDQDVQYAGAKFERFHIDGAALAVVELDVGTVATAHTAPHEQ
jgi:hypothetical protein